MFPTWRSLQWLSSIVLSNGPHETTTYQGHGMSLFYLRNLSTKKRWRRLKHQTSHLFRSRGLQWHLSQRRRPRLPQGTLFVVLFDSLRRIISRRIGNEF